MKAERVSPANELADKVGDVIRARVDPLARRHIGDTVLAGLEAQGLRVIRGDRTTVNAEWLARVFSLLDYGPPGASPDHLRAAAYDRLVGALNAYDRGRRP